MAPVHTMPLSRGNDRSYCIPMGHGHTACGPYNYAEFLVRERLASGEDPEMWIDSLGPMEQRLVREVQEQMRQEAISRALQQIRTLRANIVRIANREYDNWHDPDITETQPAGRPLVRRYWRVGVRRTVTDAQAASEDWQAVNFWSSAFVSYVMREAGAGSDFRYAWAHAVYARAAIDNRLNNSANIFKGYRLNERTLEAGDIVVAERDNSGATYDTVQRGMFTHGDIITHVNLGTNIATAIGGNVNQNVDDKQLAIDGQGHLTEDYFVVIKIEASLQHLW